MTQTPLFQESLAAVVSATGAWNIEPARNVPMPVLDLERAIKINSLWTDGGLRPNANNLAFLIQEVPNVDELELWRRRFREWPIRGALLVNSPNKFHLLESEPNKPSAFREEILDLDSWKEVLNSGKSDLFKPKNLSKYRDGQLSLADLEETVTDNSFTEFLKLHRAQINEAFQNGINAALNVIKIPESSDSSRDEIKGHVVRYAIAYLAARIMQDKNFFGTRDSLYSKNQDPRDLLREMRNHTNGFFRRTMEESDQYINEVVRKQLALHMGPYYVSFALTDHRDVGTLYERAIKKLPAPKDLTGEEWSDLNRHYTPVKIAERMLEALPLERLRPEERYIFDPAAGSGSLLLAATSRLAGMSDIPTGAERKAYLEEHVAGNDRDEYAPLIAKLRYFLASESLAKVGDPVTETLPFPEKDKGKFICADYEKLRTNDLPFKPKVIVANPPFIEEKNIQKAASFVRKALEWLDDGSQFSFVLPQSFLSGTTHHFSEARKLLDERCKLLEIWQLPEKSVGTNAEQAVCVISGIVDDSGSKISVSSKAVYSRVKDEVESIRKEGFTGVAWINQCKFEKTEGKEDCWKFSVAPPVLIDVPTIQLGYLFYVFNGVNPGKFSKVYPAVATRLPGIPYKRNWRLKWRDSSKLWADPNWVPENELWIRYGKEYLEGYRPENEFLFNKPKLLVARKINRGSNYPLAAQFDQIGFCPDNNLYCILPAVDVDKYSLKYQKPEKLADNWLNVSYEDKCLWLLGICTSKLANSLSLIGRKTHEITVPELCRLPLPFNIDSEIINITRQIINLEKQRDESLENQINDLRRTLDKVVEASYGNPAWKEITRVGKSPDLIAWEEEQKIPTKSVIGQILDISEDGNQVFIYISRLMEDDEHEGEWVPLPQELPGWALDGTPFDAELSHDVKTFDQLRERPWALRKFRHEPRAYLKGDELKEFLNIPDMEISA